MKKFLFLALFGLLTLSACNITQPKPVPLIQNTNAKNTNAEIGTSVSIVLPTADRLKFCNGGDMDSAGFRKTITKNDTVIIPGANLDASQLASQMLVLAAQKADMTFPQSTENPLTYVKVTNQTAYIQPTDGWAGVSISLCAWQPFVEVNLLQLPGIKKVVWVSDPQAWQDLTK
jgi:hypothetical protein